ncbi:hypothetical protein [Aureimonas sp. ME7]|uniref:hypothetical protein n=1 Tax=Aureimonas sp. ME7 TaxID=2744252 RepID=UPI0015F513E8|nr:hypothetical protein [Aureimonas sp. ME7]
MSLPLDPSVRAPVSLAPGWRRTALSPLAIGLFVLAACAILLSLPISLPLGPMYWDVVVYIDGGWRVLSGQIPAVDFFAPIGPLGYWLFAAGMKLFPQAQPVLLAQWMVMPITLGALLPVLQRVDRGSRALALALLLPFLVFQLLPTNLEQYSTYPSFDGYGIYNRHVAQLLYPLAVALVFERRQRVLLCVVGAICTALFLTKITGFVAGGMLCAFAFAAGRVRLRTALGALLGFAVVLGLLQLGFGLTTAYLSDIALLVSMNEGVLLSRFLQASSLHFGILASGCLLVLTLLLTERRSVLADAQALSRHPLAARGWTTLLDRNAFWLAAALFAGLFFETQNTGSQAFLFVWPILLSIACNASRHSNRGTVAVLVLVAATAMPPFVNVLHRSSRAIVGQLAYPRVPVADLKMLFSVTQRPEVLERATAMLDNYAGFPDTYRDLATRGQLPTFGLYSDLDFQASLLMTFEEAVEAVRALEAERGVRFETVMSLNFVNPFPYLLERKAPLHIAIGADPFRAVPPLDAQTLEAVRDADLILYPTCPITTSNEELKAIYADGLKGRTTVPLGRCWTGYVRAGLSGTL